MLPLSMQVAFEARDINALDAALSALPPEEEEVPMGEVIEVAVPLTRQRRSSEDI